MICSFKMGWNDFILEINIDFSTSFKFLFKLNFLYQLRNTFIF